MSTTTEIELPLAGMSCAACAARIERVLSRAPGVAEVHVNFATATGAVRFDATLTGPEQIAGHVRRAGFDVVPAPLPSEDGPPVDAELRSLRWRAPLALLLAAPVVVLGMSHGALLPGRPGELLQLVLTLPVVFIAGAPILRGAVAAGRHGAADMNTLVATGALAALIWSTVATFVPSAFPHGDHHGPPVYYESAAAVIAFVLLGRLWERQARARAGDAVAALLHAHPPRARRDGVMVEVTALRVGDRVEVRAGEVMPVDGVVREGDAEIEEALLTGEPLPVHRAAGSPVVAGSTVVRGAVVVAVLRAGSQTGIARLTDAVRRAQHGRTEVQGLADRIAAVFTPVVIGLSLVTLAAWLFAGATAGDALQHAIAVLIVACPCALGLATPIAVLTGTGRGSQLGVLWRGPDAMEAAAHARVVLFDKTGTLTVGRPSLHGITAVGDHDPSRLLHLASALEARSEHPVGRALRAAAPDVPACASPVWHPGRGVRGQVDGHDVIVGTADLLADAGIDTAPLVPSAKTYAAEGATPLHIAVDGLPAGVLAVADALRPEAQEVVARLRGRGVEVVMLTGDRPDVAAPIAAAVGIDRVRAGASAAEKAEFVRELVAEGRGVVMVGDGLNDAAALADADLGVALGSGADVAQAAADVTLLRPDLRLLPVALDLSRATLTTIRRNLGWAFAYNVVSLPLAAGALAPWTGLSLSPMAASAMMSLSSLSVVLSSLTLRAWNPDPGAPR